MYRVNSVSKALAILDLMLTNQHDMSLGAISHTLELNESTANHLVSTLVMHGYLKQRKKYGKYSLGVRFLEINENNDSGIWKRKETIGYIVELSRLLNEAVHLLVWYGSDILSSRAFDYSDESIKFIPYEWSKIPLHCTCFGKLILANMSNEDIDKYFRNAPVIKRTPKTITDCKQMKTHLGIVRRENLAFDIEECFEGVTGIAAAIKNHESETVGSIHIEGPLSRLPPDVLLNIMPMIKDVALQISRALGYQY